MKKKKVKNRNKNELSPKSGARKKPMVETKIKVEFEFIGIDGKKYGLPEARLKVNENGGASCLIKTELGWKPIKGKLNKINMVLIKKL